MEFVCLSQTHSNMYVCTYLFPILVVESTYVHKYMVEGRRDERHSKVSALSSGKNIVSISTVYLCSDGADLTSRK